MEFSTQLRLILLLTGALTLVAIYLLGKRHGRREVESAQSLTSTEPQRPTVHDFGNLPDMDDDELDTPAYLRRNPHEARLAESLPTVMVPADEWDEVSAQAEDDFRKESEEFDEFEDDDEPVIANDERSSMRTSGHSNDDRDTDGVSVGDSEPAATDAWLTNTLRTEPVLDDGAMDNWTKHDQHEPAVGENSAAEAATISAQPAAKEQVMQTLRQPMFSAHATTPASAQAMHSEQQDIPVVHDAAAVMMHEPPTIPAITPDTPVPIIDTPVVATPASKAETTAAIDASATASSGTTLGKSEKREVKAGKRKIIALRLAVPGRIPGEQLLSLMQREDMQHGRFDIFHRMHEDASVFSMASMVEPGTFDLATIREQQFPGVTFFMLLPGPLDGLVAWDQMLNCAQRMAHFTEGVLQDERGHKLTSMAMDRLREEVLDFQHLLGSVDAMAVSSTGSAANPTPG